MVAGLARAWPGGLFLAWMLLLAGPLWGHDRTGMVVFNGLQSRTGALLQSPGAPLEQDYGINIRRFWPDGEYVAQFLRRLAERNPAAAGYDGWLADNRDIYRPLDDAFARALLKSKLLYIGQYAGEAAVIPLQAYPAAIGQFLAAGGVVFFDYGSTTPSLSRFLESVGVANPSAGYGDMQPGGYTAVLWQAERPALPLLAMPHDLSRLKRISGHGWWEKWADNQYAPFRNQSDPKHRAAMIVQEQVNGYGRIVFNQISGIFRGAAEGGNRKLLENVLSWIFERNILEHKIMILENRGGPGESSWPARGPL